MKLLRNVVIEFKADSAEFIRKQYNLDEPARMNEAIDILEGWLKKQSHFEITLFERWYLERLIVNNKGLLEKCKKKLDKLCTMRTLIPDFFEITEADEKMLDIFAIAVLPQMTSDFGRVYMVRISGKQFESKVLSSYFKYLVTFCEYLQAYDYCYNVSLVIDWTDINIMAYLTSLNMSDVRKSFEIVFEGFSLRVKGIHMLTQSRAVESAVVIMKQLLNKKLGGRIHVHTTLDSLQKYIPIEILPTEYGGKEQSIYRLRDEMAAELRSNEFITFRKNMNKATVTEAYRLTDKFQAEYLGIPGTFRALSVD